MRETPQATHPSAGKPGDPGEAGDAPAWRVALAAGAPIGGRFRVRPEDFEVEELPAYAPCGTGEHLYVRFEKRALTSAEAARRLARALGCRPAGVGLAGKKDAWAVTRQTVSLAGAEPGAALALTLPGIRVLGAELHGNKLRTGHLAGNRFALKLRDVARGDLDELERRLAELCARGLPNAFGAQRFGHRGDNDRVGRALLGADAEEALALIAGRCSHLDTGRVAEARRAFDDRDYARAARTWPRPHGEPRAVCRALASGSSAPDAVRALAKGAVRFYVSALQASLFNRVLARRLDSLDRLFPEEPAYDHALGRAVRADEPERSARLRAFELSPTGPLFGRRCGPAEGPAGELEESVLAAQGLAAEAFRAGGALRCTGERRPLRVPLGAAALTPGEDEHGAYARLAFDLPPGSFATTLLDALGAGGLVPGRLVDRP